MVIDLKETGKLNAPVKGVFVVSRCDLKPFKQKDGNFMQCELTDRSGSIKGIIWDGADAIKERINNKMAVEVAGEITRYNDIPQVIIKTMIQKEDFDPKMFLQSLPEEKLQRIITDFKDLNKREFKNPLCKKIWNHITNGEISEKFFSCPGGIGDVHHSYLGGLAEHAHGMVQLALNLSDNMDLDQDILITGCILHDIGKIRSYNWSIVLEMTDIGRLLHHTSIGYSMFLEFVAELKLDSNDPTLLHLAHIIISHHGDEGIRKPMTAEATATAFIDALNAMTIHARDYSRNKEKQDPITNWTKFCQLTGRQYYMPKKAEIVTEPKQGKIKPDIDLDLDKII